MLPHVLYHHPPALCYSHCHDCQDLDLCRDPSLASGAWLCSNCQQPYDKAGVEARLVSLVQARIKEFALQDVVCGRCKTVSGSSLCKKFAANYICSWLRRCACWLVCNYKVIRLQHK
jgi:DNA polymerase epsilon subunit 1